MGDEERTGMEKMTGEEEGPEKRGAEESVEGLEEDEMKGSRE